jgi:uncharacterized membrane protein
MVAARLGSYTLLRNKVAGTSLQFLTRCLPHERVIMKQAKGTLTMIKVETSIIVSRPIEEVFAYVSDFKNTAQWQSGVVEVRQTSEGPVGKGTQLIFVRTFLGRKLEGASEVVEHEPPTKNTLQSTSGPLPFTVSRIFEPTPEGTKMTIVFEMQPGGVFALAEPLIARSLKRSVEADFGNLKDLLESRAGAATF